jgi:hypothetical protein
MIRRAVFGVCGLVVLLGFSSVCWADDGLDGAVFVPHGSGLSPARGAARAVDLEPRLIGSVQQFWDGGTEGGLSWTNNVIEGSYVQPYNINGTIVAVIVCAFSNVPGKSFDAAAVVYEDDGPGGAPGTLLAMSEFTRIPAPSTAVDCSEITVPATPRSGRTFVGVDWLPSQDNSIAIAFDTSGGTPVVDAYGRGRTGANFGPWSLTRNFQGNLRAFGLNVRVVSFGQATSPCFNTGNVICLNNGRFRVELRFRRPNDNEGLGTDANLKTNDSATLWFFNPANLEMLIKVLNACSGGGGNYWVFFAATTNVELHLTVTDTQTGAVKTYFNPLGKAAPPVQDTSAFATCP